MNLIETLFFNKNYKKLLRDNLKSQDKKIQLVSKITLFLLGGIAFGAFFVGSLGFQLIGHDNKHESFLYASTALSLVFGSLLIAGLSLIGIVDKKMGSKAASLLSFFVIIIALVAFAAMVMGSVAYVRYN